MSNHTHVEPLNLKQNKLNSYRVRTEFMEVINRLRADLGRFLGKAVLCSEVAIFLFLNKLCLASDGGDKHELNAREVPLSPFIISILRKRKCEAQGNKWPHPRPTQGESQAEPHRLSQHATPLLCPTP